MKVSVIIPVYNVEKYIERCIQSIINQSLQDFEIIIVNDATPDTSMLIVQKYAKQDSRIKTVENPQNMGLMWTRREGYRCASGNYIVFCDSDDYLPEKALEILYNAITEKKADIVVGSFQMVSERGKGIVKKRKLSYGTDSISVYKSLLDGELNHSLWGKIFDKKLFENSDYETFAHQTNGEDGILFYQIVSKINKLIVIDDVVYYYFVNIESATHLILTEKKCQQIMFAWSYRGNCVRNINALSFILRRSEIRVLLKMLKQNYNKDWMLKFSTNPDIEQLFRFKTLSRYYSGFRLLGNYMIMHSKMIRKFTNYLAKFKKNGF
jgi:glycosyltransferase involved in cell wall biosynthesis